MKLVWETGELSWTLHRAVPGALTYETGTDKIPALTLLEASSFSDTLYFKVLLISSSYPGRNGAALQWFQPAFPKGWEHWSPRVCFPRDESATFEFPLSLWNRTGRNHRRWGQLSTHQSCTSKTKISEFSLLLWEKQLSKDPHRQSRAGTTGGKCF